MVLVDPTYEDTMLMYQGRLVRVRESAKGIPVPSVQTMQSSPPKPPTKEDIEQFELNQKMFGAPKITPPLVVLLAKPEYGNPPPGISVDDWQRINEEKRQQKVELTNLSRNSRLVVAEKSGHHIQLDEPQVLTDAIRLVVDAVRHHTRLAP